MVFSDLRHHLLHLSCTCQLLCRSVNRPSSCSSPSVSSVAKLYLTLSGPHGLQSPLGYSVNGISQARTLKWVGISSNIESSQPRDQTHVSCTAGGFFTLRHQGSLFFPWSFWTCSLLCLEWPSIFQVYSFSSQSFCWNVILSKRSSGTMLYKTAIPSPLPCFIILIKSYSQLDIYLFVFSLSV